MRIGTDIHGNQIDIPARNRDRHVYISGQTGTGKSTLLEHMIRQDLEADECVIVVDPHGTTSEAVVRMLPHRRRYDLVYIQPSRIDLPPAINFFDKLEKDDRPGRAGDIVAAFVDYFGDRAIADRSEQVLRNTQLALMEVPGTTLLHALPMLSNAEFRADILEAVKDPLVKFYWTHIFEAYSDKDRAIVVSPITNKLDALFSYPAIRHTFGQPRTRVDFDHVIENKQVLVFNLSGLPRGADSVFGSLMVSMAWAAMKRRKGISPAYMYIDEFPIVATRSIPPILSEARKFKLSLTLAHQYWGQVDEDIKEAVYGNVGTLVSLRMGPTDAPAIARQFDRSERQILDLKNYQGWVRGIPPTDAILFNTDPPVPPLHDLQSMEEQIRRSQNRFGEARSTVEDDIRALFSD